MNQNTRDVDNPTPSNPIHEICNTVVISQQRQHRVAYLDLLRVLACLMVVLSHSCDPFVGKLDTNLVDFTNGSFWGSLQRACVPLFVMISGALLLPIKDTTKDFYKRRMTRVLYPFLFWAIVTPILFYLFTMGRPDFPQRSIDSLPAVFKSIITLPLNFNDATVPLWYIYMLIGLYLILPMISPWVEKAGKKGLQVYLGIWGVTLLLPYAGYLLQGIGYDNKGLLGICDWNSTGTLHYFSGFLGYMLLGHYLRTYPFSWSGLKTIAITIPVFILSFLATFWGFTHVPKEVPMLEMIWYYTNINVCLMTASLFVLLQRVEFKSEKTKLFWRQMSIWSFGIFLCHFTIVQNVFLWVDTWAVSSFLKIPSIALISFGLATVVTALLYRLPFRKYIIG
ncbi:MAG TPA: acyltransferase [Arachidicoccus sp.]|nr:acyltransferase [Arachidicoccus sp.]